MSSVQYFHYVNCPLRPHHPLSTKFSVSIVSTVHHIHCPLCFSCPLFPLCLMFTMSTDLFVHRNRCQLCPLCSLRLLWVMSTLHYRPICPLTEDTKMVPWALSHCTMYVLACRTIHNLMDTVKHSVDQPFLSLYPRGATYTSSTRVADCTTAESNKTIETTGAETLRIRSALWPGVSKWERPK